MASQNALAPLAPFQGARPAAPAWFENALGCEPERLSVMVEGAAIETLTWGQRGRPGILFLHGNAAHADWWSFIAPYFSDTHRCAAMSWSGMGGSDWRERYSLDLYVQEMLEVMDATGLFEGSAPAVVVAHSFGGFPTLAAAARFGERLRAAVIVDTPLRSPQQKAERERNKVARAPRPARVYPSIEEALVRFRFMPVQPVEHPYIADLIARRSLRAIAATPTAAGGYTWKFDPFLWQHYRMGSPSTDLQNARCPIAFINGARSGLVGPEVRDYMMSLAPAGTVLVEIPQADHHVMVDQPLAFVSTLRTLLQTLPVSTRAREPD